MIEQLGLGGILFAAAALAVVVLAFWKNGDPV